MRLNDYNGKAVVVTGGTKGIGRAIGLAFARAGAHVYLTHRWGSADETELRAEFAAADAAPPVVVEADVSSAEDTSALMERIGEAHERVEVFISNVCVVQVCSGVESYRRRSLLKSLEYSAWPLPSYLQAIHRRFGRYPRYTVGISSDGPDHYFTGYELVALSKAVMETLCRYLAKRLSGHDARVNILRSRNVPTDAVKEIFGPEYLAFMRRYCGEAYFVQPGEVAQAVLALCSGLMDGINGQILQVDKGAAFADTTMRWLEQRDELGL